MLVYWFFIIVVAVVSYIYATLRYTRLQQYSHLPQIPPSAVWGHLKVVGEFVRRGMPDRHPGMALKAKLTSN
jgi:hypothetical protein